MTGLKDARRQCKDRKEFSTALPLPLTGKPTTVWYTQHHYPGRPLPFTPLEIQLASLAATSQDSQDADGEHIYEDIKNALVLPIYEEIAPRPSPEREPLYGEMDPEAFLARQDRLKGIVWADDHIYEEIEEKGENETEG